MHLLLRDTPAGMLKLYSITRLLLLGVLGRAWLTAKTPFPFAPCSLLGWMVCVFYIHAIPTSQSGGEQYRRSARLVELENLSVQICSLVACPTDPYTALVLKSLDRVSQFSIITSHPQSPSQSRDTDSRFSL
jgi:hypothetical protein